LSWPPDSVRARFPAAIGVNPSLTITAMTERVTTFV
jgi:hypothetical protein